MLQLKGETVAAADIIPAIKAIIGIYKDVYFINSDIKKIQPVVEEEINRFNKTLKNGLRLLEKIDKPSGKQIFDLYQSYGFPMELTQELLKEKGFDIDKNEFEKEFEKHKNLSRISSAGMFKGGLADNSEQTIKYHTATHLLHQALFNTLGDSIRQEGSNITGDRLRFDFYSITKPTEEQIKQIEEIINEKIQEKLPVEFKIVPKEEAVKLGAKSFFREKYPDMVKVYFVGNYSKEFCGGPHVKNTSEIGKIEIYKFEKIGSNLYRIYAK
jgi:alanyl-tRNA synthetase